MEWIWLIALLVIVVVIVVVVRPKPAPRDYTLPPDRYYSAMLIDDELELSPLLDTAIPLPTFRTSSEGSVTIVNLFDLDQQRAVGGRRSSSLATNGEVNFGSFLSAFLSSALEDPSVKLTAFQPTPSGVQVTAEVKGQLHDFRFVIKALPELPVSPRRALRQIGYFSQAVQLQGAQFDVIQRYYRPVVEWQATPSIPTQWYPYIDRAFDYWNQHLQGTNVRLHFGHQPWIGDLDTTEVNLFSLVNSSGFVGVGTTAVDGRTGEHQWSRIHIDPSFARSAIFPTNDDQVFNLLQYAITHELGHTLGLRHYFTTRDGYPSVMAYLPQWYPDAKGDLHYLHSQVDGRYDRLAIDYGYSLDDEEKRIARVRQANLLFHTDENIDLDVVLTDPHRHTMQEVLQAPTYWMRAFAKVRPTLFQDESLHVSDVKKVMFFLSSITEAVTNITPFVRGYRTDSSRTKLTLDDRSSLVLTSIASYLIGDTWRLDDLAPYLNSVDETGTASERPRQGSYTVDRLDVPALHLNTVVTIASSLLAPTRMALLPNPGELLVSLLTLPSVRILTPAPDLLQQNVITGFVAVIESNRPKYSPQTQASFDTALQVVATTLKDQHQRSVIQGVVTTTRRLQETPRPRKHVGCHRGHLKLLM